MNQNSGRKSLVQIFDSVSNDARSCATASLEGIKTRPSITDRRRPLHGTVICLSGIASEAKECLHALVEKLGGSYTRDFNLDQNTHLVIEVAQGAKYQLAASHSKICIVTPTWLEECEQQGRHVEEGLFPVIPYGGGGGGSRNNKSSFLPESIHRTHDQIFDIIGKETNFKRLLFECHQFYLMGFEDSPDIKQRLGCIIRRGGGTIHWELSDDVTTLVIYDTCHDALRKAALVISSHHPNLPPMVSPRWVVDSFRKRVLIPTAKYPPLRLNHPSVPIKSVTKSTKVSLPGSVESSSSSKVFRGQLFAVARVAPPENIVDFDSKEQEILIRSQGGQILTPTLVNALAIDAKNGTTRKKCFVVCWGGMPKLEHHPLLSQLKHNLICDLVLVTPIWLRTCVALQKMVLPRRIPEFFVAQSWSLNDLKTANLRVSLTGFMGSEKVAWTETMKACHIRFLSEMTSHTTHLVCREKATGLKLEKAIEWGIHIVSMDWMYYILRHGYTEDIDSDDRFLANQGD